jgi:hypothetical protein
MKSLAVKFSFVNFANQEHIEKLLN